MKDAQKPDHVSLTTLIGRLREGRYVIPDFGYAIVLSFRSPDAATFQETSDAIAATAMGC